MNLLPGWTWLIALAAKRPAPNDDTPDPGDMGTAFGLDASMGAPGNEARTAGLKAQPRQPWSQRLVRRPQR